MGTASAIAEQIARRHDRGVVEMVDEVAAAKLVVVGHLVVDLQYDLIEIHRARTRDLMLAGTALAALPLSPRH